MIRRAERGSILLLVLFVCLAIAVIIQTLTAVVVCAERCAVDESVGRRRVAEKEEGFGWIRERALGSWAAFTWTKREGGAEGLECRLDTIPTGAGLIMEAAVRQPTLSRMTVSARVERGRDGLDLPVAALVAREVLLPEDRAGSWLETSPQSAVAFAHLVRAPAGVGVGPGCGVVSMRGPWGLDDGWRNWILAWAQGRGGQGDCGGMVPGPGVVVISGEPGRTVRLPDDGVGVDAAEPVLVLAVGGGRLDLRDLGEVHGVVVVDGGSLLLDGTCVHGAVFATDAVDVGASGQVVYEQQVLRWATDRSLYRVRLVPGSRRESME